MFYLTPCSNAAMLFMLLTHSAAGICSPFIGHNRPLITVAFLRSSFLHALNRVYSMVGCIGQPLRLAGAYAGTANLIQSTAQYFAVLIGGLSLLHRNTAMKTTSQGLQSAQKPIPVFALFFHRQLMAIGVNGSVAMRVKARNPQIVIKFVGMEG